MELAFNTSDQGSPQIDAESQIPNMLPQTLANLLIKKIGVDPPAGIAVQVRS